jgi:general secretion pathway protein D
MTTHLLHRCVAPLALLLASVVQAQTPTAPPAPFTAAAPTGPEAPTAVPGPAGNTTIENPADAPPPSEVTLNLKNADIQALISAVSDMTGKNFVVDPRVQGTVTVISARPTSREALYDVFLSVLKVHGFAAVPSGKVIKIVPELTAKQDGGPVSGAVDPGVAVDDLVTLVVALKNTDAQSVIAAIQPFASPSGHLTAHAAGNTLVMSDSRANADRLLSIVDRIDQAITTDVEVLRLRYADAADLASTLNNLRGNAGGAPGAGGAAPAGGGSGQVVADERTNSLLFGGPVEQRLRLRALISHLDTPVEGTGAEVIYLRYAKADELAPLLTSIATGAGGVGGGAAGGDPAAPAPLPVPGGGAPGADGGVRIQADENTNALIIQAPPETLASLKSIIRQLDIRRAQVYVEGLIAEVSDTTARELGVQWQTDPTDPGAFGITEFPGTSTTLRGTNLVTSVLPGLTLGYLTPGNLQALIRVLGTDAYNNVLSTPTVVTLDNEEAEIVVGQNVPFVTGQFTNNTTTPDNPFQTIERQDVGVKLKLTPQVNEGDSVQLTIEQEVSSVVPSTAGSANITTNKRAIKTTVLIDDGQVLVIGGLIDDSLQETIAKVPLLGDLPLLGAAFRNKRTDSVKRNLMVFLRPSIIRDQRTGSHLTMDKYDRLRLRQSDRVDDPVLPGYKSPYKPQLPPFEGRRLIPQNP